MGDQALDPAALAAQAAAAMGSQTKLAAELRVTQECVSLWASGKRRPPWSAVVMMQRILETQTGGKGNVDREGV